MTRWGLTPNLKFEFLKKTNILNSIKSLGQTNCYSSKNPRPIKSPFNSIRYKLSEDLFEMINKPIIYNFYIHFTNHRKKFNNTVFFRHRFLPNILKFTGNMDETLQKYGKHDSFRQILKTSAKGRKTQVLSTTTGIQSGSDYFEESRPVIT